MEAKHGHRDPAALARRSALVLYGSETGNAQDVAEEIARLTERRRFHTTLLALNAVQLRQLVRATVVIFVISTAGQGEVPQNARAFWTRLLSSALKPAVLRSLRFSSFGLGDSSYPHFNRAHRVLHARLLQLGARPFCERGEGNEQHPEGHSAGLREWSRLLAQNLTDAFPLPSSLEPIPDHVFVEPQWKLQLSSSSSSASSPPSSAAVTAEAFLPSPALLPIKDAFTSHLASNDRITSADHFQDVRLLDFRIQTSLEYGPGAVAVIYPKNFPEDVQQFIDMMAWNDVSDQPLKLVASDSQPHSQGSLSPLSHLDTGAVNLTLRWLLENVLDIMSIPRRSFFTSLAYFARTSNEDESYQRERLLELANPELIDELWDYTTRPKRTIVEVMMDFTTVKIPWQYALSVLPIMRGRQFSICSGGALKQDDEGRTRVQLLVAIVDPPSPIIKWRRRYGVCTRYLSSLTAGTCVNIGIQKGYLDVTPEELQVPVLLIGPGTGLAPMRAMIHERLAWAKAISDDVGTRGTSRARSELDSSMLFFGCRSSTADFFFRSEFIDLQSQHGLLLHVAFSRDHDLQHPREYVQDKIRAHAPAVYAALTRDRGKVYVCGSSGNMPKGVRQAILDVLVDAGMATEDAEMFVASMEKNGRYKQETW